MYAPFYRSKHTVFLVNSEINDRRFQRKIPVRASEKGIENQYI